MILSFRDLDVYKESYSLMIVIHKNVNKLPLYERTDLISQLRRASKSIPSNIAEGWGKRRSEKFFKNYLDMAIGSANEMESHIEITKDLNYWNGQFCDELLLKYRLLGGKLTNLKKNWITY